MPSQFKKVLKRAAGTVGGVFIASVGDATDLKQDYPHFRDWKADMKRHCGSATLGIHGRGKIYVLGDADVGTSVQISGHCLFLQQEDRKHLHYSSFHLRRGHITPVPPLQPVQHPLPCAVGKEAALNLPPILPTHQKNQPL